MVSEPSSTRLSDRLDEIVARFSGEVGYVLSDPRSGTRVAHNADIEFPTASVIKLPLLTALHSFAEDTGLDWGATVPIGSGGPAGGSGILAHLDGELALSHRDLAWLMICVSDNLATNLVIDTLGGHDRAADLIRAVVSPSVHLRGRAGGHALAADTPRSSLSSATPAALGDYLDRLSQHSLPGSASTVAVAEQQLFHSGIPRYLDRSPDAPVPLRIAHKTGALPGVRTDIGIVSSPARTLTVAVQTAGSNDLAYNTIHEGDQCIGAITRAACQEWLGT